MKYQFLIKIIAFVLAISTLGAAIATAPPQIESVSMNAASWIKPQFGITGGNLLYIRGYNFGADASSVTVLIHTYPCVVVDNGVTESMITCQVTPYVEPGYFWQLTVHVIVNGVRTSCNTVLCKASYDINKTPFLNEIWPRNSIGGKQINFIGKHRITAIGDARSAGQSQIRQLLIGDTICSLVDVINKDSIESGSIQPIGCTLFKDQESGQYNVTENVFSGYAQKSSRTLFTSLFTNVSHEFRVLPSLSTISYNSGSQSGNMVSISGTGFPQDLSKYNCQAAGEQCFVKKVSKTIEGSEGAGDRLDILIPRIGGSNNKGQISVGSGLYPNGNGFKYTKYDRNNQGISDTIINKIRNGTITHTVKEEKIVTELSSASVGDTNYIQYIRGFFHAPVAGDYNFAMIVDDAGIVYLSTVPNSKNTANLVQILKISTTTDDLYHPYTRAGQKDTKIVTIASPGYYYMEIFTTDFGGGAYYKLMVNTPQITNMVAPANPTWQISQLQIKPNPSNVNAEIWSFNFDRTNYTHFAYACNQKDAWGNYIQKKTAAISLSVIDNNQNVTVQHNSAWAGLSNIWNYRPQISFKQTGANVTITFTFQKFRKEVGTDEALKKIQFWAIKSDKTQVKILTKVPNKADQQHSVPISGKYSLTINLKNSTGIVATHTMSNLDYNYGFWNIEYVIRDKLKIREVDVSKVIDTYAQDQLNYIFQFVGVRYDVEIIADASGLTGGIVTTQPFSNNIFIRRAFSSTKPLFNPIPYDFLKNFASKPSLQLKIKNIPALNRYPIQYDYLATNNINLHTSTLTGNTIKFNFSSTVSLQQIKSVQLAGSKCGTVTSTATAGEFQCSFTNLNAGTGQKPKILIEAKGFANADAVTGSNIPLSASSASPNTCGNQGGCQVTILGSGFPIDKQISEYTKANPLVIKICGSTIPQSSIISVKNTEIKLVVPSIGSNCPIPSSGSTLSSTQIVVQFGSQTSNAIFTYDSSIGPIITSLSVISSSPIVKKLITITGSNFGPQSKVTLTDRNDASRIYSLGIISVNTTEIKAVLGGGKTGVYDLMVATGQANSNKKQFKYEVTITSVSTTSKQPGGGYLMTITGTNFVPKTGKTSSMLVFIYTDLVCPIVTATETQIVCTVPKKRISDSFNSPIQVAITSRITEQSKCAASNPADCKFAYEDTDLGKAEIAVNSTAFYEQSVGANITIYGGSNTNMTRTKSAKIGGVAATIVDKTKQTFIVIAYPRLSAGTLYQIQIIFQDSVSGIQYKNYPGIFANNTAAVVDLRKKDTSNSIFNKSLSTEGTIIIANVAGFPTSTSNSNLQIYITCSGIRENLRILSITSSAIEALIPSKAANTFCDFNVSYRFLKPTENFYTYAFKQQKNITFAASSTVSDILVSVLSNDSITFTNPKNQAISQVSLAFADANGVQTSTTFPMIYDSVKKTWNSSTPLPAGRYLVKALCVNGFAKINTLLQKDWTKTPSIVQAQSVSYAGGQNLVIQGSNFIQDNGKGSLSTNDVRICGLRAKPISADDSSITVQIPALVNKKTQQLYKLAESKVVSGNPYSDASGTKPAWSSFDNSDNTFYSSSNMTECFIGLDFGIDAVVDVQSIRFDPSNLWLRATEKLKGAIFEGNDGSQWVQIFEVDTNTAHSGWNFWKRPNTNQNLIFSAVRFRHVNSNSSNSNSYSNCQLAGIQIIGKIYSTMQTSVNSGTGAPNDNQCNVEIFNRGTPLALNYNITYEHAKTAVISAIIPNFGPSSGNTVIHLQGSNMIAPVTVKIDGIDCVVNTANSTQSDVYCTTGVRVQPPAEGNSFVVTTNSNKVKVATKPYLYVDRFSNPETWGGETPPRGANTGQGDSIHVPVGQTLLIDESVDEALYAVIVEGKIIFADQKDMNFHAKYFVLNDGSQFVAGTEESPYQHKLTITMHGDYYDKHLPIFGNKGIGCKNCKFSMHGRVREPTWTELSKTANAGDTTIELIHAVDWKTGQQIIIASTTHYIEEAERRTILSVDATKKIITLTEKLNFKHISVVQSYDSGNRFITMRAEVGLLTRNILMQGDPEYEKHGLDHGSHLLFTGKESQGLVGQVAYSEFRFCGQPKVVGRYCTHFHMAGQVPRSYVRGISVHDSHARMLTIHGTHYLTVEKNVGYKIKGHNIFLEDGIQTNNVIQDNLLVNSLVSLTMTASDVTVASYWITNPYNTVRRNHAAGGQFYGFWYEIFEHPTGPSSTPDICPMGMPVQESKDNVAHSYIRFGLRIFKLSSRENPCETSEKLDDIDPYTNNTAIHSVFDNFTLWRNQECGFLGEKLGYMTIQNFKVADNFKGGMQFHKTNFTHPVNKPVVAKNCLIVGKSNAITSEADPVTLAKFQYQQLLHETRHGTRGLYVSRTDGMEAENIHFANFDNNMTPLQSCSECWHFKLWVVGSKTTIFRQISYENIQGNYVFWQKWQRAIFIDQDGTLTGQSRASSNINSLIPANSQSIQITPYRANLINSTSINGTNITSAKQRECYFDNSDANLKVLFINKWNSAVFCQKGEVLNASIPNQNTGNILRDILFANMQPAIDFKGVDLRVRMLNHPGQNINSQKIEKFGIANQVVIKPPSNDIPNAFAMPFRSGKIYNVHWKDGIDFTHMSVAPSAYWQSENQRVLLRFPYNDMREIIQVQRYHSQKNNGKLIGLQGSKVSSAWKYFRYEQTLIDPVTNQPVKRTKYNETLTEAPKCVNGQFFNDRENRFFWLCVSGQSAKNLNSTELTPKPVHQWIDVVGIKCQLQCPGSAPSELYPRYWMNSSIWANEVIPGLGNARNATIFNNYSVTLNDQIKELDLDYLIINGSLQINQVANRNLVIKAKSIIVLQGASFTIGTPQKPITSSTVTIYLNGSKTDIYTVLDVTASGNKMLGVSGMVGFYASSPANVWTRLSEIAVKGTKIIKVLNAAGWKAGDQIVIAPTYKTKNEHQRHIIASISGNTITLTDSLAYQHYGSASTSAVRSESSYPNGEGRDLDARGGVGLLSRKIKITNGTDGGVANDWGCRILVSATAKFNNDTKKNEVHRGVLQFKGVQVSGCGQYDSTMAGLRIQNLGSHEQKLQNKTSNKTWTLKFDTNIKNQTSELVLSYLKNHTNYVQQSSIHTCQGYCMYIENSRDINVSNNVFYFAQRQIVYAQKVFNYTFADNLLIWAHKRAELTAILQQVSLTEDVACYQQHDELITRDPKLSFVEVTRNLAQGSEGQGFVFPFIDCDYLADYPFQHNTAGSCEIGFMFEKLKDISPNCLAAKSMIAYASEVGLQANPPGSHIKLIYENAFFSDNQRGITLRYAHETDDNTMLFRNSEILGYSRQTENIHSTTKSWCNNAYAVRMFTATISGQTFPLKKKAMIHDVICTQQAFDFKAFLINVTFRNFRNEQPDKTSTVKDCTRMSVFRRHHGASDGSAPHYLKNSPCINCDKKGLAFFEMPGDGIFGWFGGCGQQMNCTGPDNILIHDTDGKFVADATGIESPAQIFGQGVYQQGNTESSYDQQGAKCEDITTFGPMDRKFLCRHEKLVLLQYESLAPDRQTRVNYPITIYDDQKYKGTDNLKYSRTNAWKQWQWDGPEPMNLRIARFWSVVRKDRTYNVSWASQASANTRYQLNRRNPSDNPIPKNELQWLVLRVFYPLPNTIEVLVNGELIKPQIIGNEGPKQLANSLSKCTDHISNTEKKCLYMCGANNFHYQNGTIEFVVNNQDNCQVQVRVTSSIKISMRLDIQVSDFYKNTGTTNFIDNIAAFLNIDPGRIRIVGVRTGSVIVDYFIAAQAMLEESQNQQVYEQLSDILDNLRNGVASGTIDFGAAVLEFDAAINIFSATGDNFIPVVQTPLLTILVAVLVPVLVVLVGVGIGVGCYLKRKRAKIGNEQEFEQGNSSDMVHDKPTRDFIQAQKINNQLMVSEVNSN